MLIRVNPGRALRWSPPWPCSEATVLFDANSGDYWVLAKDGQQAVRTLEQDGPLEQSDLVPRLPGTPAVALALLQDLARSGIITPPEPAVPLSPEPAVHTLD